MNKMNKKGFTLIEMLVVIAIIAVLVSIIIPTVTSSTDKAAAATDAANLRSAQAVLTTGLLDGTYKKDGSNCPDAAALGVPATSKLTGDDISISISAGVVSVSYGEHTVADYAAVAEGTVAASEIASSAHEHTWAADTETTGQWKCSTCGVTTTTDPNA